jgi:hypothetical protein
MGGTRRPASPTAVLRGGGQQGEQHLVKDDLLGGLEGSQEVLFQVGPVCVSSSTMTRPESVRMRTRRRRSLGSTWRESRPRSASPSMMEPSLVSVTVAI